MGKLRPGISLLIGMLAVWAVTAVGAAAPDTTVRLNPNFVEVNVGDQFTLEVWVENVTALNGVDLRLTYDPAALQVQDGDPWVVGTQIQHGRCLQPDQISANNADGGVIHYRVEQLWPHEPVNGSCVVARITFQVLLTGTHTVAFDRILSCLIGPDGTCLPGVRWVDATIVCPIPPTVLTGTITRQGWPTHDRTVVWTMFMVSPNQIIVPPGQPVGTDPRGVFTVTIPGDFTGASALASQSSVLPLPSCPQTSLRYKAAFVQAGFPKYLSAEGWVCLPTRVTRLRTVTLPGGDVNNDRAINILDIRKIINDFGKSVPPPCAVPVPEFPSPIHLAPASDVNGDCQVDIRDLALASGNFGKGGPIPMDGVQ
ncbi:MAG TPA: cohesin domain-containing protein [Anaerolineae bacterium]|nr:cohesin domain-containing protein [Anaerolineae bacterium]